MDILLVYLIVRRLFLYQQKYIMSLTTLKEDLLAEFREERVMISEQMELLDPLATSLRRPVASRLLSHSTLLLAEFACYILSAASLSFIVFFHRIYPFNLLKVIFYAPELRNQIGGPNLTVLISATYALLAVVMVCVFIIGRMAREIRLKNEVLQQAGETVKVVVGQHLVRHAAIKTIEQRHLLGAPIISVPSSSITASAVTK